jgi:small subunit ribosomal protein S10
MPKTKKEAQALWEKLKEEPDHFTLLHMYKKVGIEPIKLAKYEDIWAIQKPAVNI